MKVYKPISDDAMLSLEQLSCEEVASRLGMNVTRHRALCFMHDDHHPSLSFYGERRNRWFCFVCCKGGNAISLVREYYGCNFLDACHWLCNTFGIDGCESKTKVKLKVDRLPLKLSSNDNEARPFAKDVAKYIIDNSSLTDIGCDFLFTKRLLNPDVIKELNIVSIDNPHDILSKLENAFSKETLSDSGFVKIDNGRISFRLFTPCLIFPYYDAEGELIGLQSRFLGDKKDAPRFQFTSSHKTHLYNLPILKELKQNEDLYISEGITDCLALLSSGMKAVAIPSATILPKLELTLLSKYKLHMFPDQDDAGINAFQSLRKYFISMLSFLKEEKLPAGVKDYSDYYLMQYGKEKSQNS